jgi:hypothetical protein
MSEPGDGFSVVLEPAGAIFMPVPTSLGLSRVATERILAVVELASATLGLFLPVAGSALIEDVFDSEPDVSTDFSDFRTLLFFGRAMITVLLEQLR